MYVSITGLKLKGIIGWMRFWAYTIPASKDSQKKLKEYCIVSLIHEMDVNTH
jgi:uncharacterized protein YbcC (UPF0753/DUF2309 family)